MQKLKLGINFLFLLGIFTVVHTVRASTLEVNPDEARVPINITFSGDTLKIYGATDSKGKIIVTVQGGEANFTVKKKEKLYDLWVIRIVAKVRDIPAFYRVLVSKNLKKDVNTVGILFPIKDTDCSITMLTTAETRRSLCARVLAIQYRNGQYKYVPNALKRLGKYLFVATLHLPNNIMIGNYTIKAFTWTKDKQLQQFYSKSIPVERSGIVKYTYSFAHNFPLFYGLFVVVFALFVGLIFGLIS